MSDFWANETARQAEAGNALYASPEASRFPAMQSTSKSAALAEILLLRGRLREIEALCDQESETMTHFTLWSLIDDIRNVARKP